MNEEKLTKVSVLVNEIIQDGYKNQEDPVVVLARIFSIPYIVVAILGQQEPCENILSAFKVLSRASKEAYKANTQNLMEGLYDPK